MKLGIIGSVYEEAAKNIELFQATKAKGLDFLEFCINGERGSEKQSYANIDLLVKNENLLKECTEESGVGVGSIGRWGSDRIDSNGKIIKEELEQSCRIIDASGVIGCPNFVCGCNFVEGLSLYRNATGAIEFLGKLIDYGKSRNVKISTYNCRGNSFIVEPSAWKLIHGELCDLGIKFDPSHSIGDGGDYLKEMADWGHRFYHVHIKGSLTIGGKRYDDPPAGLDQTDWGSFMSVLYSVGYKGGLSIEPHSRHWTGELGEKGLNYTISFMKNLML